MAQPYYTTAANLAQKSATPLTADQINNFYNPMASNVTAQLQNIFGQQQGNTTRNLTQAAGGIGADRIAVGQANLANQQGLAAGQTYANLYQQALQAAQQNQAMQANAAYGMGSFGKGAQNAALQGAQAQLGTGGLQQQLAQAQLNAPYQQQLQRFAYPFQTAQYLAGITGGLAPALGGTTTGSQSTTQPAPSTVSQIAGAGMAGIGLLGGFKESGGRVVPYARGGATGGAVYPENMMQGYAYGGDIGTNPFGGGIVPDIVLHPGGGYRPLMNMSTPASKQEDPMATGAAMGKMFSGMGGMGNGAFNLSQLVAPELIGSGEFVGPLGYSPMGENRGGRIERADGGDIPFNDRFDPAASMQPAISPLAGETPTQALISGLGAMRQPVMSNLGLGQPVNWDTGQQNAPVAAANGQPTGPIPAVSPGAYAAPAGSTADNTMPPAATGQTPYQMPQMPESQLPYPGAGGTNLDAGQKFARSPWMALVQAGLATMGGTSPFAGVNIGRGGLEGIKALQEQRAESLKEADANMRARQLWQQAQFHADQYSRMTPYQSGELELKKQELQRPFPGGFDPVTMQPLWWVRDATGLHRVGSDGKAIAAGTENVTPPGSVTPATSPPSQVSAPPATISVAPSGGKMVNDSPDSMVAPFVASTVAQTNPDVLRMYPTPQLRARGIAEASTESNQFNKQIQAADLTHQRSVEMGHSFDVIDNFIKSHPNDKILNKLLEPGATGQARQDILNKWTYANKQSVPQDVLAAINLLGKDSILGGFTNITATGLSAREAQPIINAAISAMPSFGIPEQSSRALLASMDAASQRVKDMKAFMDAYRAKNGGLLTGWREAFDEQNPAEKYVARAVYNNLDAQAKQNLPRAVQELRQARDQLAAAEHAGDAKATEEARKRYNTGKLGFDRMYGGLGNYFAFGRF